MRLYEDFVSDQKLLTIEADYMPASTYANNTAIVAYRQDLIQIITEVYAPLSFKIRYAAVNYFDRFASSLEESVVLEKDCKLLAFACLITAAKVEMNDIFIYDLASGDLLDFLQDHIFSAQIDLLQGLGWRLRLVTPLCFTDYVESLLYEEPVKFRDTIEKFLLKALNDITFTKYRPSVLAASTLLTVHPVDNYEQRLAHCALDMNSLRDCIEQMKTIMSLETAVKVHAKTAKPAPKAKVASSSSDDLDSDSEDEEPKSKVPVKAPAAAVAKNGSVSAKKKDESSDDSDSDDSSEDDEPKSKVPVKAAAVTKNGSVSVKKDEETSDDSDDSSSDDEMPSKVASQVKNVTANKNGSVPVTKKKEESSETSESEDESDDEDETPAKVASKAAPTKTAAKNDTSESESDDSSDSDEEPKVAKAKKESSSDEDSSEEESEEDKKAPKTPKKVDGDVEMVDADSAKSNIKNAPQTPSTPQVEGSKTLFMGNLSFSIEQADVENFFKEAGEVVDVRFASDRETGQFKGFGHVEFATAEAAQNALKLHGHDLLGRQIKLDLARERGAYTPASGNENSYQKGGRGQAQATIFVRGFDTSGGEEQVRNALQEHFGSCGDITRVSVPKDFDSSELKGIAYMDFTDSNGLNKALELNGSELGEWPLTVEEAKPRDSSFSSGVGGRGRGRSDGGGGRFSGGRRGRGRFGGDSGGRFGSGGRSGGGRGGRGGRGGFNKPSMATPGTGKKTTFDD